MVQITRNMLIRISNGTGLSDPCVICGKNFSTCEHTMEQTAEVIKASKLLDKQTRQKIMDKVN